MPATIIIESMIKSAPAIMNSHFDTVTIIHFPISFGKKRFLKIHRLSEVKKHFSESMGVIHGQTSNGMIREVSMGHTQSTLVSL